MKRPGFLKLFFRSIMPGEATGNSKPATNQTGPSKSERPQQEIGEVTTELKPLPDPKKRFHTVLIKRVGIKVEFYLNGLAGEALDKFNEEFQDEILEFRNSKSQNMQINFCYYKENGEITVERL